MFNTRAATGYGRSHGELPVTVSAGERLVRLPLGVEDQLDTIIRRAVAALS